MDTEAEIRKINTAVEAFINGQSKAGQPYSEEQQAAFRRIINQAIKAAEELYHFTDGLEYSVGRAGIFSLPGERREGPRHTPDELGQGVARDLKRQGMGEKAANLLGDLLRNFERSWLQEHPMGGR